MPTSLVFSPIMTLRGAYLNPSLFYIEDSEIQTQCQAFFHTTRVRRPTAAWAAKARGPAGSEPIGSPPLFPQDVIDPAQGRGRMGKADGAGEQDDGVVDLFRSRPGL